MDKLKLMASFIAVVEQGTYTNAAKRLGKTKAIVSKQVCQLEEHLQVRLVNRTTRTLSITDHGRALYDRCCHILDEVSVLESASLGQDKIAGRLRISAPQSFGESQLMDVMSEFMTLHPNLNVELVLTDRFINLIHEGFDIGLRIGLMEDSCLIAREIAEVEPLLVASPGFVKRYGIPKNPADLEIFPSIHDSNRRSGTKWFFNKEGEKYTVTIAPKLTVNSAVGACKAAVQGIGISLSPDFSVNRALQAGELVHLMPDYRSPKLGIYALYPHRQHLTAKVRVLVEFLMKKWH